MMLYLFLDDNSNNVFGSNYLTPNKNDDDPKPYSPNGNWKISNIHKVNSSSNQEFINSPVGKWSVEKDDDTTILYKKNTDGNNLHIKRVLFNNNKNEIKNSGILFF